MRKTISALNEVMQKELCALTRLTRKLKDGESFVLFYIILYQLISYSDINIKQVK